MVRRKKAGGTTSGIKHGLDHQMAPPLARALRRELWIKNLLAIAATIASLSVLVIFCFLVYFSAPLFGGGQLPHILSWQWRPFQGQFGILPMVVGSVCLSFSALALAFPLGLGLSGFVYLKSHQPIGRLVFSVVQFMTSIPTVVYGFVAVFLLIPFLRESFSGTTGYSWLAAGLILSLLILPTIVLLMHSQLSQVDANVRLATASLGLTPVQELLWVILPLSFRGMLAAGILGFGRALGDTLIALMLSGNAPQVPHSPLDAIRTLTAHIALVIATDSQSMAYYSIFASGLIIFSLTVAINLALRWLKSQSLSHEPDSHEK
ncbi:PstC family ABC transporter permease [Desulfobacca acetoxidans]|nr:phosphate ABC transporter permease [Desulfobacterales bacterium]